jgi:glycosyltransferase involved in cell wall biosynthesis
MKSKPAFRALFLIENVPYSLDTRVRREAHALMTIGGEITVICPSDGADWVRVVEGVHVYQYPKPALGPGFLAHLAEYVVSLFCHFLLTGWVALRRGFDVIHVANPPDLLWLIAAPYRLLGKRFIFDHHDLVPELFEVRYRDRVPGLMPLVYWLERCSVRLADHVITTNETFRRFAIERSGKSPADVSVVRNGPWLSRDFPDTPRVRSPRADGKVLVGYLGIMNPQDHLDHLLRAAHAVRFGTGRKDIEFVLIGSGDAYPSLLTLRQQLGLADCVSMPGTLPWMQVVDILSSADICVQPDPPTRFNRHLTMNKLMEYMALGKPTIAYDMPETRCSAGHAAIYPEEHTPEALAAAIIRLSDDSDLRVELGRRARERIESSLCWEHQQASLLKVYRTVLQGRIHKPVVDVT